MMEQPPEKFARFTPNQKRTISRVLAGIILGPVVAFVFSQMETSQAAMGKAEFLASQSVRYDTFVAHPPSIIVSLIAGFLFVFIFIGAYELLAFVIYGLIALFSGKQELSIAP